MGELRGKAKKEKFPKLLDLAEAKGGEREIPDLKALRGLPCDPASMPFKREKKLDSLPG